MSKQKSIHPSPSKAHEKRFVSEDSPPAKPEQQVPQANSVADAARQSMISDAAYYLAQKRGFTPGRELDDWLAAEAEIAQSFLEERPTAADLH